MECPSQEIPPLSVSVKKDFIVPEKLQKIQAKVKHLFMVCLSHCSAIAVFDALISRYSSCL